MLAMLPQELLHEAESEGERTGMKSGKKFKRIGRRSRMVEKLMLMDES